MRNRVINTDQILRAILLSTLTALIVACTEQSGTPAAAVQAEAIEASDECHLCGMIINNFPGPKGELLLKQQTKIKKFCSTRDLFAFLLQPENRHRAAKIYVHDMATSPWDTPNDKMFIDAKTAWYVIGHSQRGAMGPTLSSFKTKTDAQTFRDRYNGRLIRFDDITIDTLSTAELTEQH